MKSRSVNNWKKELARDFLSVGSWIFFVLIVVRILILPHRWPYLNHLLVAGGLILIVELVFRNRVESYVSRGVVIAFYISLFYEDFMFSIFSKIALGGLVLSSRYLGNEWKKIGYGVLLGLVGAGIEFVL